MKYGRRPHFFENGRRTTFLKMKEDLNILENRRRPTFFENGTQGANFWYATLFQQPTFFFKWKRTLIFLKIEDGQHFLENS